MAFDSAAVVLRLATANAAHVNGLESDGVAGWLTGDAAPKLPNTLAAAITCRTGLTGAAT
ncbi:hypothetical protein [Mycobacterium sp. DL440]|uniref:hypothetical protein n=1 Tax=Mycobacterium sp. DL440 TaxID=2675523 RepID=UPI001FBAD816|nr:hypothetical protein [Mycobacterium sp. DL440]